MKNIKSKSTVLRQICNIIPPFLVKKLAIKYGVDKQARSFLPWSHIIAMLYVHIAHSLSSNDVMKTCYGTASGCKQTTTTPRQAYLSGFDTG